MLIRKDKLLEAGLFHEGQKIAEDEDVWLRLAYLDLRLAMVWKPVAIYHIQIPDSATKTVLRPEDVNSFLSRHLILAEKAAKSTEFKSCARFILGHWTYKFLWAAKSREVRKLLKKYGFLLTPYGRWTSYLGSLCPTLWRWNEKRKHPELE
jgi:hypothetical protein